MEILEAFYRRKLKKKQKKSAMFHSEMQLNRAPSLASVGAMATGGETTAAGLITRVLHFTRRRDSRPHSWHSTKLGDVSCESVEPVSGRSSAHSSAADLLSGLSSPEGGSWSLESLEPHTSVHPGSAHLGPRSSSSCLQLSSTRSSSSDLLHSKRDSAYSSCSPSLSFPEGLGVETSGGCYHGASENRLLNRHSLGPIWSTGQSSYENLKGAPAPQRPSETYTSTSQERPSSWSSLEHARSLRSLRCQQKGSWPHPSSSAPSAAKGLYMTEGQLHTVIEKSPESSPSSRPKQAQSPGPLQETLQEPLTESSWAPSHSSGSNLGLYPTSHRDHWNGYSHTYHRAPEAERSLKDSRDQLDMFSSVTCLGSLSCHSAPAPQSIQPQNREHPLMQQEHPLTRLEKALVEVQGGESTCLSVLEKVSQLEHREWATRQLGLSSSNRHRTGPKQADDKGTSHGAEDVRSLSGRSTSHTLSHGGGPQEKNRSCQDLRESQTQMFWSTSSRCTNPQCAPPVLPLPVPPKGHSHLDKRDSKQLLPPEKTRPKTLPKPHAGVFTSRPSAHMVRALTVLSLPTHTPLPAPTAAPPPGAPPLTRICGRKRLTWDQKKRSFSEPECMNEIGLTHTDSTPLLRRAGDTSVADRRRMFEQAAQGLVGGASVVVDGASGQDAQFGLDRKCSQSKGRSQRRPHSALLQPHHTPAESMGLVTSSSLLSLKDCAQEPHLFSGKGPLSSPLAPRGDRHMSRSIVFYPGRVTAPRAPALQPPNPDAAVSLGAAVHQPAPVSQSLSLSLGVDRPLQKTPSEDTERTNMSLCSPPGGAIEQAERTQPPLTSEDHSLTLLRAAEGPSAAERLSPPPAPLPPVAPSPTPDPLSVPVSRRERAQRSNLAASVGLPCPLSDRPLPLSDTPLPLSVMPLPLSVTPLPLSNTPLPLSVTPLPLSITPRSWHSLPPSDGWAAAPAKGNQSETSTANTNMGGDKWCATGGSEPKHQPPRENRPIGCEDRASTVHGADGENDSSPPALPLKTQPNPSVLLASSPSVPPASSPDEVVQNSLGLDYEPVPVRLQSPEEQRVQELLQTLVHSDGSLAPLMDVWDKSTVDVLLEICPNSPLFAELSQEQRQSSLQDHWSQGPVGVSAVCRSQGPVGVSSKHDLVSQKVELCEALRSCIESLEREKAELSDAFRAHTELGARVEVWVQEQCEAAHRDKYLMFTGDLERVVNLLLSLCGRLARVERSLSALRRQEPAEGSTELWDSLVHKRSILLRQIQDALELRDHLERRQCTVHAFLRLSLESSQLQQYQRLVSFTPVLLIAHRRLEDALQQSQEQLSLLLDTLPLEVTQARGWSRVGLTLSATPLLLSHSQAPLKWYPSTAHVVPRPPHLDCPVTTL